MRTPLMLMTACLGLAACGDPQPRDKPEPQATELRDAMQAPVDKAKQVQATQDARNEQRDDALDDTGG